MSVGTTTTFKSLGSTVTKVFAASALRYRNSGDQLVFSPDTLAVELEDLATQQLPLWTIRTDVQHMTPVFKDAADK